MSLAVSPLTALRGISLLSARIAFLSAVKGAVPDLDRILACVPLACVIMAAAGCELEKDRF